MLQVAREHSELLAKHGLFGQLERADAPGNGHRRAHVGARTDLEDTVADIMKLGGVLDGMSRDRSAKNVIGLLQQPANA